MSDGRIRDNGYQAAPAPPESPYEPQLIPGLLQTENYIRALWSEQRPDSDPELVVRARKERQRILHRWQPAWFTFFLHENALRVEVGEPAIMHEQLLALLLLDGLPQVTIRVVPALTGAQAIAGVALDGRQSREVLATLANDHDREREPTRMPTTAWRKSSYSHADISSDCVEVALVEVGAMVRDSKNADGPALRLGARAWESFLRRTGSGPLS